MSCCGVCKDGHECKRKCECNDHKKTVKFILIRHGFSCANASGEYQTDEYETDDPALTDAALEDLKQAPTPKVDIVFCSSLLRAQETALHLFRKDVYVVPYISEVGTDAANTVSSLSTQKKWHKKAGHEKRIHYEYVLENGKFIKDVNVSSWPNFLKWTREWLKDRPEKKWTIAVVCHADLISRVFDTEDYPYNLGQISKTYEMTNKSATDVSPTLKKLRQKGERVLFAGVPPPKFEKKHVQRCYVKK